MIQPCQEQDHSGLSTQLCWLGLNQMHESCRVRTSESCFDLDLIVGLAELHWEAEMDSHHSCMESHHTKEERRDASHFKKYKIKIKRE